MALPPSPAPTLVYIYEPGGTRTVAFDVAGAVTSNGKTTLTVKPHEYFLVKNRTGDPDQTADLPAYTFAVGTTIEVAVYGPGATVTTGLSDYLGKAVVFTGNGGIVDSLIHELTRAFGLAHRCGNWDYRAFVDPSTRQSCNMS